MIERRRHPDSEPRCTYAASTVTDNCKLVRRDSFAHAALAATDWEVLVIESDFVLMQAPAGFVARAVERLPL